MTALEQRGVGFKSLTEAIDTTSPGGKLVFHIFGALAEFERVGDAVFKRFNAGKHDILWYYRSLSDVYARTACEPHLAAELKRVVDQLTGRPGSAGDRDGG